MCVGVCRLGPGVTEPGRGLVTLLVGTGEKQQKVTGKQRTKTKQGHGP